MEMSIQLVKAKIYFHWKFLKEKPLCEILITVLNLSLS